MTCIIVTEDLKRKVRDAMANPHRFERQERFAMKELLRACEQRVPLDKVFVDVARKALQSRGVRGRGRREPKSSGVPQAA